MNVRHLAACSVCIFLFPLLSVCQNIEKVSLGDQGRDGYYLAVRPQNKPKGALLLLTSFTPPENLMTETKLQNVAFANDLLTVVASTSGKLYADSIVIETLNKLFEDVEKRFSVDTSKFVLAGFDEAGNIALRFTELSYEFPTQFPIHPKAVFGIDTPVDLFGLWHWAENQIKKNYWQGSVGDAHYYIDTMTKENGTIYNKPDRYNALSPFNREKQEPGNEQYLKKVPVRLYYDTDIEWQLKNRRNSYYDTKIPDASEMIKRLLLLGNDQAEFIPAKPGMNSNGTRRPTSISIVEEVECIQWIRKQLGIIDVATWSPPYHLAVPQGWNTERFALPADFAPGMNYIGIEDLRFAPGWGNNNSEEYWSYCYLWWLEQRPITSVENVTLNLKKYYEGLVGRNIISRKIPAAKVIPVDVAVKKIKPHTGDLETYSGTVSMLDYMTEQPIVLNITVHVSACTEEKRTAIFVMVSPKKSGTGAWIEFDKTWNSFQCTN